MRVRIDASNLVTGGGVQVASSFVDELLSLRHEPGMLRRFPWLANAIIWISGAVANNCQHELPSDVRVWKKRRLLVGSLLATSHDDVVFHVFGPRYGRRDATRVITGFADVLLIYEWESDANSRRSLTRRYRDLLAKTWFKRSDHLIVETRAVKRRLADKLAIDEKRISVVPNAVNAVFANAGMGSEGASRSDEGVTAVYVTRPYPHKNLRVLPAVAAHLEKLGLKLRVITTLSDDEWADLPDDVRAVCRNVGRVDIQDVPALYHRSDLALFPSLAECFSATPLEAMATRTPLVASDRDFVRETCDDYPIYVEPTDPRGMAEAIAEVARRWPRGSERWAQGSSLTVPARERAIHYLMEIDAHVMQLTAEASSARQ